VLYRIDRRSGDAGRILWRMDPGQDSAGPSLLGRLGPDAKPRVLVHNEDILQHIHVTCQISVASPSRRTLQNRSRSWSEISAGPPRDVR